MKKQSGLFDITMGAYDGAEVCELVGTYMLFLISEKYNKKYFGLYRDDGLGMAKNKSEPETEKIKKNITKIFKENKSDIAIQRNMKIVNYLDVLLNLNNPKCKPHHKPDNEIYIHKESNHPPSILKQISTSIERRISTLSSNRTLFNVSKEIYQKTFKKIRLSAHFEVSPCKRK